MAAVLLRGVARGALRLGQVGSGDAGMGVSGDKGDTLGCGG